MKTATSLNLWNADALKTADIKVLEFPIELKADTIAAPTIEFANQRTVHVGPRFTWKGERYIVPTGCGRWAAYAFLSGRDHQHFDRDSFKSSLICMFGSARCEVSPSNIRMKLVSTVLHLLISRSFNGVKFAEQRYQIVSQCLRFGTMNNVVKKSQHLTNENIVNKTNVKFGGLNYSLQMTTRGPRMLKQEHAIYWDWKQSSRWWFQDAKEELPQKEVAEGSKTIILLLLLSGFLLMSDQVEVSIFVGDFVFQQPQREEKVDVIASIVKRCTNMFHQARVLFLRESSFIEADVARDNSKWLWSTRCRLLSMLFVSWGVTRLSLRHFCQQIAGGPILQQMVYRPTQKPDVQNIQPGVVIDHTVVHPIFCEFFLNSHRALQGTARTPKYTILLDENNMKLHRSKACLTISVMVTKSSICRLHFLLRSTSQIDTLNVGERSISSTWRMWATSNLTTSNYLVS
uniref:Piwi domain-containing protein n=1 Tax=Ditylenchus dipsaci TaxID=166011 RepID=A0A915E8E3_9BILA